MKKLFVSLLWLFMTVTAFAAIDVKTYVPEKAKLYLPLLKTEQLRFWPDHPVPLYLGGLVEQESCLSLTHSRCWSPKSKLKTQREEGASFGQVTRAYRKDGSLRFDSLTEMSKKHPSLKDWNWGNVYDRPDLALRAMVLMNRDNYNALGAVSHIVARLSFADAAYNGGLSGVQNERRACGMKKGCDPQLWFGHVEHVCLKSKTAIYGNRSACDINREHVHSVMKLRSFKYAKFMT